MELSQYANKEFNAGFSSQIEKPKPSKLLVKYSNWKFTKAELSDAADPTATVSYILEFRWSKPHLLLTIPNEPTAIGIGTQHLTSTKIDIDVRGQSFEMRPVSKWVQKDYFWTSPALQGQTVTWKATKSWSRGEAVCLTAAGELIGRIQVSYWDFKKVGEFDISGIAAQRPDLREEIIVTGLMMGYLFVQKKAAKAAT